jgi:hypothetical protein
VPTRLSLGCTWGYGSTVPAWQPALVPIGQTLGLPSSFMRTGLPGRLFIFASSFYNRPFAPSKQPVMPTYAPTQVGSATRWRTSFGRSIVTDEELGPMFLGEGCMGDIAFEKRLSCRFTSTLAGAASAAGRPSMSCIANGVYFTSFNSLCIRCEGVWF